MDKFGLFGVLHHASAVFAKRNNELVDIRRALLVQHPHAHVNRKKSPRAPNTSTAVHHPAKNTKFIWVGGVFFF